MSLKNRKDKRGRVLIMGHSSIDTTMDIYTDLTKKRKHEGIASLQGKIALG